MRIDDRFVLRDMLLLDRGNLGVQLARHRVRVLRPDIGVVVVGLVLGGHDGRGVQFADRVSLGAVIMLAQIVLGRPMLIHGGPARNDVGMGLQDVVRILAFQAIEQRRIAVEMVEVLQQSEPVDLRQIRIGLVLRHCGRDLDGDLFIRDGGFQRRMVGGDKPVDGRLLMLLDAPDFRQRHLQVFVHTRAQVLEAQRFHFQSIGQDDPDPGKRFVIELADGGLYHVLPSHSLFIERHSLRVE